MKYNAKPCLESKIRNFLINTRKGCSFKKAWIPKGWACVNINKFSKELVKEIENVGRNKKKR